MQLEDAAVMGSEDGLTTERPQNISIWQSRFYNEEMAQICVQSASGLILAEPALHQQPDLPDLGIMTQRRRELGRVRQNFTIQNEAQSITLQSPMTRTEEVEANQTNSGQASNNDGDVEMTAELDDEVGHPVNH